MNKTQNSNSNEMVIDLVDLAKALWCRAWAIVLTMVIFGGAALATPGSWSPLVPGQRHDVREQQLHQRGQHPGGFKRPDCRPKLGGNLYCHLEDPGHLEQVIEEENLPYDYETLSDMIEAGAVNSTEVFEIQVTSADPEEAERIANCVAEILPDRIAEIVEGSSVKIVDYAIVPSQKSSPASPDTHCLGCCWARWSAAASSCCCISSTTKSGTRNTSGKPSTCPCCAVPDLTGKNSGNYYYKNTSGKEARS